MTGKNRHKTSIKVSVTGGAGSGKSSVCKRLRELGAWVISADELARKAVEPGSPGLMKIIEAFGKSVLKPDGALNRRKMRRIIMADEKARKDLESLIHPEILHLMNLEIQQAIEGANPLIIAEVPLLFELGLSDQFDHVVMVAADPETKIRRIMARDQVSETDARTLVNNQLPDEFKAARSDFVIRNDASLKNLMTAVDNLYQRLIEKSSKTA